MARVKFAVKVAGGDPKYPETGMAVVPGEVVEKLGGGGRIPIAGTVNGFGFRTTIIRMHGVMCFCVNATMREGGKTGVGKTARFEVWRDEEKRVVEVPGDVKKRLGKELMKRFSGMSYTHQKEWVLAINEAKKAETRERRVGKLVEAMKAREK